VARNARITDKHKAEVTVYANGAVIRAQEGSENLYASIDLVSDKISRQLRKYKERLVDKSQSHIKTSEIVEDKPVNPDLIGDRTPELPSEVVRMKYFAMPPMTIESLHTPSPHNLLGAKGVGEAGCIGIPAAIMNAARDALSPAMAAFSTTAIPMTTTCRTTSRWMASRSWSSPTRSTTTT
jgi:hypothetical protein